MQRLVAVGRRATEGLRIVRTETLERGVRRGRGIVGRTSASMSALVRATLAMGDLSELQRVDVEIRLLLPAARLVQGSRWTIGYRRR